LSISGVALGASGTAGLLGSGTFATTAAVVLETAAALLETAVVTRWTVGPTAFATAFAGALVDAAG
jgi:hypothetical protein